MTITLKNVSRSLHQALKHQAKQNKRSLNQEVIKFLEEKAQVLERKKAFAVAIRYRNELSSQGIIVGKKLDPTVIIRKLRDSR